MVSLIAIECIQNSRDFFSNEIHWGTNSLLKNIIVSSKATGLACRGDPDSDMAGSVDETRRECIPSAVVYQSIWDVCVSLVECAPEYSAIHEDLGTLVGVGQSTPDRDALELLVSFLGNNKRCTFIFNESYELSHNDDGRDEVDHVKRGGESLERMESLNLAGFSLDNLSKDARDALERCARLAKVQRLYLSGNALRSDCLDDVFRICSVGVLELFLDTNVLRTLPWDMLLSYGTKMSLTHLDISKNMISRITCNVLDSVRNTSDACSRLEWLDLSGNPRLEFLPDEGFLSSMPYLKRLDLHSCMLRRVPKEIGMVKHTLEHLSLHSNCLIELPDEIGECTHLAWMSLNCNMLERLPHSIGNLVHLQRLSLHINKLQEIPESISKCTHIEALSLHSNDLRTIPESIGNLQECVRLSLYHNPRLETIPDGICNMTQLKELWMYDCGITYINPNICRLKNLQKLWLDRNPFDITTGVPWDALKCMDMLQELYLDDLNNETGICDDIGRCQEKRDREAELKSVLKHLKTLAI